ncbi:MAG: periplasmic heavy metal sensor [Thermodesulfovibrionales bacterium]|nr:periplasmic heavy metal sensor [Thermodesulfovibrionales bacterium]
MKKLIFLVLAVILLSGLGATVYAGWGHGGWDWMDIKGVDIEKVKKFQKETLSLRDELHIKKLELRQEYEKDKPDLDRIAQLRKEIIDLQTKIQKIASSYGLPAGGPGGCGRMGRGFTGGMRCGCQVFDQD